MREVQETSRGWSPSQLASLLSAGEGRPGAAVLLILSLFIFAAVEDTAYRVLRLELFDVYQRLKPRELQSLPVAIIDIDEVSIAKYGQWPWPRTLTAKLVEQVASLSPLAIAFDFVMPEPDRLSPQTLIKQYPNIDPALKRTLDALPTNDAVLASSLKGHPVIVGRAGLAIRRGGTQAPLRQVPVLIKGPDPVPHLAAFAGQLANVPEIEAVASGFGLLNARPDADGVLRRVPLVMNVDGQIAPSLGLEILRIAFGAPWFIVHSTDAGVTRVQAGKYFFPTESDGSITLHFTPADSRRRLSSADVLEGTLARNALEGQVALIGVSALGLTDRSPTPISALMDGVEIRAQVVENLLEEARLVRPADATRYSLLALALTGLVLIVLLPRLRPAAGALLWLFAVAALFGSSYAAFYFNNQLLDPIYPALSVSLVFMFLLSAMLSDSIRKRKALDAALEHERLDTARMSGELDAAREIQMGMLPDPTAIEGLRAEIRLHAMLKPAREVGGDLYDAYMLDEHRLFFLVGDVSGKGVPASLFMALSKTLCKSVALRASGTITELVNEVNDTISRENPGLLFVTAVAGVLDARTGEVELCNAGHDAPLVFSPGEAPRELKTAGGPPLCVVDDFPYTSESFRLSPGQSMLLWTDGVSEAMMEDKSMYGRERITRYLENLDGDSDPRGMVDKLYLDVEQFMGEMEAYDDITIMAIQYVGPSQVADGVRNALRLSNELGEIDRAAEYIDDFCTAHGLEQRAMHRLTLIVEELITNSVKHGGVSSDSPITLAVDLDGGRVELTYTDTGVAFNPLCDLPEHDRDEELEDRRIGGLGWPLILHYCESTAYSREGGENRLILMTTSHAICAPDRRSDAG